MMTVVPAFAVEFEEQFHNLFARFGIEVAGWFIGHQDGRVVDQCAGNGHALLLSAGKLGGAVVHAVTQADRFQRLLARGPCVRVPDTGVAQGSSTLESAVGAGQQVEALEDKAHLAVADDGQLVIIAGRRLVRHPGCIRRWWGDPGSPGYSSGWICQSRKDP